MACLLENHTAATLELLVDKSHFIHDRNRRTAHLAAPETFYGAGIAHYLPALPAVYCTNASGQNRLIFGLPFHNRKDHERRKMPGVFTSVNPLCIEVHPECTFEELMQGIHKRQKKAFRHHGILLASGRNWV